MARTIVVTGANRGLGLGLTKYFLGRGEHVIATARQPDAAIELKSLKSDYPDRLTMLTLDVKSELSIKGFGAQCAEFACIDVLVNNAGVLLDGGDDFRNFDAQKIMATFEVNTIGPMRLTQALLPSLVKSKQPTIVNMSSLMGSVGDNKGGGYYGYRLSKAALNMYCKSFSIDFPTIISVVLHPGWVKTDMGGAQAPLVIDESTKGMGQFIEKLDKNHNGRFFDYRGKELPW